MAAFHGSSAEESRFDASIDGEREAYSPRAKATIAAGALALLVLGTVPALLAVPPARPAALAIAVAALAAPLGAALGSLARGAARSAAACAIVGIALEGAFLGVLGDASRALPLGALAVALALAGAGAARAAARLGFPAMGPLLVSTLGAALCIAPFALANENASLAQLEWAGRLFQAGPLAPAASAAGADLLRNGRLYSISALGSSLPLGYPPAWLHAAVLGAAGLALHVFTRARAGTPSRGRAPEHLAPVR